MDNKLTPRQLHELNDILPIHYNLDLVHAYNTTKNHWEFLGYTCRFCNIVIKRVAYTHTHHKTCKILRLKKNEQKRKT
jgi:hypothetical protein